MRKRRGYAGIAALLFGVMAANMAFAQKQGGVLRVFHRDSPASMSILEEGSISAIMPMMGVFNNLVLFDQHVASKPRGVDRTRAGDGLVMERGRDGIEL
jgi:peptide/nickel transport system substrate-binding protein